MSATFELRRDFGTDLGSTSTIDWIVNMTTIDSAVCVSSNYPIGRPYDDSINYSYESWVYLYMTKAPETRCENFKFWGPSDNIAEGVTLWCSAIPRLNGETPSDFQNVCVTLARPHNTPGTALLVNGTCSGIGSASGYLVLQEQVDSSAAIGAIVGPTMVMHLSWDES